MLAKLIQHTIVELEALKLASGKSYFEWKVSLLTGITLHFQLGKKFPVQRKGANPEESCKKGRVELA